MILTPPPLRAAIEQDGVIPRVWQDWFQAVYNYLRGIGQLGQVTLTTGAATTIVSAQNCDTGSMVILFPITSAAATEFGAGSLYVVSGAGLFTIHHINSGTTGRTFNYEISG